MGAGIGAVCPGPSGSNVICQSDPQLRAREAPLSDWPRSAGIPQVEPPIPTLIRMDFSVVGTHNAKPIHLKSKNDFCVDASTVT